MAQNGRARPVRHAVLGGFGNGLDRRRIRHRSRALRRLDGTLHAAVGAVGLHQEDRPRLHRQHQLRAALFARPQVRHPRPHQRRPLRLERRHLRQRNRGAELQQAAASAQGRALQARPGVRRGRARAVGFLGRGRLPARQGERHLFRPLQDARARPSRAILRHARPAQRCRARRRGSPSSCRPARPTTAASSRPKPRRSSSAPTTRSSSAREFYRDVKGRMAAMRPPAGRPEDPAGPVGHRRADPRGSARPNSRACRNCCTRRSASRCCRGGSASTSPAIRSTSRCRRCRRTTWSAAAPT